MYYRVVCKIRQTEMNGKWHYHKLIWSVAKSTVDHHWKAIVNRYAIRHRGIHYHQLQAKVKLIRLIHASNLSPFVSVWNQLLFLSVQILFHHLITQLYLQLLPMTTVMRRMCMKRWGRHWIPARWIQCCSTWNSQCIRQRKHPVIHRIIHHWVGFRWQVNAWNYMWVSFLL